MLLTISLADVLLFAWRIAARGQPDIAARGVFLLSGAALYLALCGVAAAAVTAWRVSRVLDLRASQTIPTVALAAGTVSYFAFFTEAGSGALGALRAPLYRGGSYALAVLVDGLLLLLLVGFVWRRVLSLRGVPA